MNTIFLIWSIFYSLWIQPVSGSRISFKGEVRFTSDAPLEVISASSDKLLGVIDHSTGDFAFSVKLKSFQGFNSALQAEHFHENYMRTALYPNLTYSGKLLDKMEENSSSIIEVRTKGKFYINGVWSEENEHDSRTPRYAPTRSDRA